MLKCEIIKFEAQDIVTSSVAGPYCHCHNQAGEIICKGGASYNSQHHVLEYHDDGDAKVVCAHPNHTCGR